MLVCGGLLVGSGLIGCNRLWTSSPANRATTNANSLLAIEITTQLGDRQTFEVGDEMRFLVTINRTAYLTAIYQDADNGLWQVYPNQYTGTSLLAAGDYVSLPQPGDHYRFVTTAPFGSETLYAFASTKPLPQLEYSKTVNGLRRIAQNLSQINLLFELHGKQQRATLASATLNLRTKAR